ncbi:hypothetical protein DYB35_006635 [Aphanomyces astaci]|uniref:Uncharacterized protein n=1 Tax=Aphanomyces astaci TaxID=112090 RepID=A0A397A6M2_APHAT|nr:hypothetical protein DYB36_012818 [Aphanomyces astaci]RHY42829.1 hypothetical protein DYB34_012037 [Aphanomyces astaci]RHY52836.1 hypothetical protein DYB30_010054 [Aphanomyces astaci]RHY73490.1 hypothetical protein DYB38_004315 [Aphanomyces astaci]RHY80910.1 hypothetical protein DYB26_008024 [Aphanomyces astaci]
MSSQRGNLKKGAPKYQNSFAFTHNPKSKKTDHILGLPIHGLCPHCHAQIVWRKKYRKYKPLTQPASWVSRSEQQLAEQKGEDDKDFSEQLEGLKERERRKVLRQKKKEEDEAYALARAARRARLGLDQGGGDDDDDDEDLDDMDLSD